MTVRSQHLLWHWLPELESVDNFFKAGSSPHPQNGRGKTVCGSSDAGSVTTFIDTFTGHEDRARVLTEILRQGPAAPGVTLIGYVDRATLAVLAVCSLPTPDPVLDGESCFGDDSILQLSSALCAVAQESAPQRMWTGDRWSDMAGELITVVCREGDAAITPTEVQFYWGWRYSNHLTTAFDGEVYVVTPQAWASMLGDWSGPLPTLSAEADSVGTRPEVQDAEKVLADLSSGLLGPRPGECLPCYVCRMMLEFGCNGRLRFAVHYRDVRAPRATGLERRLGRMDGYCDCEIFLNGYDLRPGYWVPESAEQGEIAYANGLTWPDPLPGCTGARLGSTQPCSLWRRRR